MKYSKKPQSKPITRSSCKQNRSIVANTSHPSHPTPSRTTHKKVKHSEFNLFNQLPEPTQLNFDHLQFPQTTQTFVTSKEKLNRALQLIFKLLDGNRKGVLYNMNLNLRKLHPAVHFVLSPLLVQIADVGEEEGFSFAIFKEEMILSGLDQQVYQLIFMTEE